MDFIIYSIIIGLIFLFTIITSLAGIGAAFIIIPLLLAFGYPIALASIMGLIFNFINTLTASFRHSKQKAINYRISIPIIATSLIGAPVGALLVNYIDNSLLKFIFAIVLMLIGANILRKTLTTKVDTETIEQQKRINLIVSIILGFIMGFVSGLLGIGGGSIILPIFLFYGFAPKKAAGTTSFIVLFSTLIGFISKLLINEYEIDYTLFIGGVIVSIIGAIIGSYAMHFKFKQSTIKMIISILLIGAGVKMAIGYF